MTAEAAEPFIPTGGVDATGADTYATVLTCPNWATTHLMASCETKSAIITIGDTDASSVKIIQVIAGAQPVVLDGLHILPGTVISGKNATAGQNYANLNVSVW